MVVACLRELVAWKNIPLFKWLETFELQGDSPESRLFNFIKNKGMERYHMSASDVFCLADLMGVEPRVAYPGKAWTLFFRKHIQFSSEDRELLFSSTDSMPILVAKKLLKNQGFNCPIQTQDIFPLLNPQKRDKSAFIELKFEWEAKYSIKDALETFQSYQSSLPDETKRAFLTKLLSIKYHNLHPYLPCIFAEKIDDQQWIVKLIQDKLPAKGLQLCLLRNTYNIFEFTLEQFLKANLTKEFADGLNQIQRSHSETYLKLMGNNNWKEAFSKHVSDEQEFIKKISDCLEKKQYKMAQNLMRVNANKFSLPDDMIEKIVKECYKQAFKENDFDNLELLLRYAKNEVIIDLTNQLTEKQTDTAKKEWAAKFFALPVAEFKAKQGRVAVACVDHIKIDEAEAWLKIALEDFLTTRNLRLLKVVNHCTTILRANQKKISSELLPLFNQVGTHFLQTKDSPNLIQFLSAIHAIKIKLDLPTESILQIQEMDDPTDELSRLSNNKVEAHKFWLSDLQVRELTDSQPLIDKFIHLVKGMVYSVPFDDFDSWVLFEQWREFLVGVINGVNSHFKGVIPSKLCNSWSLYIKHKPNGTTFCEAFELILGDIPKEFIPKTFDHLIRVYIDCCDFFSLPLDMPMVNCINRLLTLHPIENASPPDLEAFDILVLKMLDKSKSIQSEPIKSAITEALLKWVVPPNMGDFSLPKACTIFTTIHKVTLSTKNRSFNVSLFGNLDRLTDFIITKCKNLDNNKKTQDLLTTIFQWLAILAYAPPELAQNELQLINRALCIPMVENIFDKIFGAIGHIHGDHLKQKLLQSLESLVG